MSFEFQKCYKLQQNLSTTIKKLAQISINRKKVVKQMSLGYKVKRSFASTKFYSIILK